MTFTRRHYLRSISGSASAGLAALAGCAVRAPTDSGDDGELGDDDTDGNGDDSGGTRPSGTGGPGVTLVSIDDGLDLRIEPAVEVICEAATPESPPRLRTTLTNAGDERVGLGEGRAAHFEYVADDSGLLTLLPPGGDYPAEPDCWRLDEGVAVTEEYRTFAVDAGASSDRDVDLYATPEVDGCLPVGEFRFETTVSIVSDDAEPLSSGRWGFTILLE